MGKPTIFRNPPFIPLKLLWEAAQERIDLEEAEAGNHDPNEFGGRVRLDQISGIYLKPWGFTEWLVGFQWLIGWFVDFDQLILTKTNLN